MGISVTDIEKMEAFYTNVLGFAVTDRGEAAGMQIVFLSRDPMDHHQIVLATGRPAQMPSNTANPQFGPSINQISFRMGSLADLRDIHERLGTGGGSDLFPANHGIAWSIYAHDPEGNNLEFFVDTDWLHHPAISDSAGLQQDRRRDRRAHPGHVRTGCRIRTLRRLARPRRETHDAVHAAGERDALTGMWIRSAFWTGMPKAGSADRFHDAIDGMLVPALRALPGVRDAHALWPRRHEDQPPPIACQILVHFDSREDVDLMLASPERRDLRTRVVEIAGLFDGAVSHIDYEVGESRRPVSEVR